MNRETQDVFPFAQNSKILAAHRAVSGRICLGHSVKEFADGLGTMMLTDSGGTLILAGVPNREAEDKTISLLNSRFELARGTHGCASFDRLATLSVPHVSSLKAQRRRIADSYANMPLSDIWSRPLLGGSSYDDFSRIRSVVQCRDATHYIISGGSNLKLPGASIYDSVSQILFLSQLARDTRKTHVVLASVSNVLNWVNFPEIAMECKATILRPVDKFCAAQAEEFAHVLHTYDDVLEGAFGFALLSQGEAILDAISGCQFLLKKWIVAALERALSLRVESVDYDMFVCVMPTFAEREAARNNLAALMKADREKMQSLRAPEPCRSFGGTKSKPFKPRLGREPALTDGSVEVA
jgi:hypothetical protein